MTTPQDPRTPPPGTPDVPPPSVAAAGERVGADRGAGMGPTRLSGTWTGLAVALVVLVLLLVFLLLNLRKVEINFYGAHVRAPLAVALLFAVVLGALLVFAIGAARILQVRMRAKRSRRRANLQGPTEVPGPKETPGPPPFPRPPPRP